MTGTDSVTEQSEKKRTIAIFDFDNTLVKGDSLWPFLTAVAGWPRSLAALIEVLVQWGRERPQSEARTFIKEGLLKRLLAGRRVGDLAPAIEKMRRWPTWLETTVTALKEHHAAGHHVVIASGSLDLYMPVLLVNLPHDALLCTSMEVQDGLVTGRMRSGNCVRVQKAKRIADYLAAHGPFDSSWGYGNYPHDLPMLELVHNKIIVG